MTLKDLERVLYFEKYVVIEPGLTPAETRASFSPRSNIKTRLANMAMTPSPSASARKPSAKASVGNRSGGRA